MDMPPYRNSSHMALQLKTTLYNRLTQKSAIALVLANDIKKHQTLYENSLKKAVHYAQLADWFFDWWDRK